MNDNVIFLGNAKTDVTLKSAAQDDQILKEAKKQNQENLDELSRALADDQVRALVTISLNYDGSINWMVSGMSSSFEIIAALESTKYDFMTDDR